MAQDQQQQQGGIFVAGRGVVSVEEFNELQRQQQALQMPGLDLGRLTTDDLQRLQQEGMGDPTAERVDLSDPRTLARIGGNTISMVGGVAPNPVARWISVPLGGAIRGWGESDPDGHDTASKMVSGAAFEAGMETAGGLLSKAIPPVGQWLAYMTGGAHKDAAKATGALMREAERSYPNAQPTSGLIDWAKRQWDNRFMPVGSPRLRDRIDASNTELDSTIRAWDTANPEGIPVDEVLGVGTNGQPRVVDNLLTNSLNQASDPYTAMNAVVSANTKTLEEQIARSMATGNTSLQEGLENIRYIRELAEQQGIRPGTEAYHTFLEDMISGYNTSMRHAYDLKVGAGNEGKAVIGARAAGEYVNPSEAVATRQLPAGRSQAARDAVTRREPKMERILEQQTDLRTIEEANAQLRGGGQMLGSIGSAGIRGGAGYAMGSALRAAGVPIDPAVIGMPLMLASPRNISLASYYGGRLAGLSPTALRAAGLYGAIPEASHEQRPAQRRNP